MRIETERKTYKIILRNVTFIYFCNVTKKLRRILN